MSVYAEKKIDCHAHVLDPDRFPYGADIAYKPAGQEIGTTAQYRAVMEAYGVSHALLVQPNSGYGGDNRCMLDAIRRHPEVFRGVAIAGLDADIDALADLKSRGVVGIALNATFHGVDYYSRSAALMEKLAELDMFVQIQVERDQLLAFMPALERTPVKVLVDHCGRPTPEAGLDQPGFKALLQLADTGRAHVKLSGYAKFSRLGHPFDDALPYVRALIEAFTLRRCMWASDWPYLRAGQRQDYGPLLKLVERFLPGEDDRHAVLWETPRRLFGFGDAAPDGG